MLADRNLSPLTRHQREAARQLRQAQKETLALARSKGSGGAKAFDPSK